MANQDPLLNGYATVQAVKRARPDGGGPQFGQTRTSLPAAEARQRPKDETPAAPPASRIGHTVVPEKTEIVCPECGYTWTLGGRVVKTYCPKCRKILEARDETVTDDWTGSIKTIGTVDVRRGARVHDAIISTRSLMLAGHVERSDVRVFCRLEMDDGASGELAAIRTRDLVIRPDGRFAFADLPAAARIEVEGELGGRIATDATVLVRAGGCLRGDIRTPHLVVEDGGGLIGAVCIGKAAAPA